jgi:hypothetical protein
MRKSLNLWWPGTELNRRRQPFQGCALPLSYLATFRNPLSAGCEDCSLHANCAGFATERNCCLAGSVRNVLDYNNRVGFPQRSPCVFVCRE